MKKIFSLILICALTVIFGCSLNAFAAGNVTYDGNAREFIFSPGSKYSPTDLFTDFKNVMPGDSITQKITVDNTVGKKTKLNVYMRSLGSEEGSEEFLSQLNLTVKQDGNSELFNAPASETAQLTDWVLLGTVQSGAKIDLDVTLNVPIEMDNNFQDAIGYLDWQFMVEEIPADDSDSNQANGGDPLNIALISVFAIAVIMFIVMMILRKRKNEDA